MGAFDQAARFAAQADPHAVVRRVLLPAGLALPFRQWLDTRTIPLPGAPDRTADLVIYHFGIFSPLFEEIAGHEGPQRRIIAFHNVTPSEFVTPAQAEAIRLYVGEQARVLKLSLNHNPAVVPAATGSPQGATK